ncbi:ATP-dependent metallopeptidase FtsH/Yme1/Tma family protein [Thermoactinomyces intermedius]|jgi:cell division protease FtsH|uniref:ATP-dependent zinc metalloprotease FtsH n=1 Tax=Thermoactinomyces intermedius TaxID=2024 RepID=A0A8I1AE09_THEIN|nr:MULTISPECIES: ATP-dependent zinc metalloprotease FtsH [Thermoactinomyces]MBA4549318.1 ATP-dependent metallopeptidase FtsH/Yme1/Tma family protein [Thermoactinomyces intermedius]MBA4835382.1 ATP-dependent metallopeptidase FtsH/Yme1/Tma family protein [Thermoactinomyces intermedius]MBH8595599.1 ATP-dependent zinc metalloprotease FtsH [Thermoactinomyces intermedius]MBH8600624.1 ATP-dependent zinc metalloprotease FtsH [Thermoactinomyces sp. CICC 23799]
MKNYFLRNGVLYIILILVTIAVINMFANPATDTQQLAYNEYRQQLMANKLTDIKVQLDGGTYHIEGKFKDQPGKSFVTRGPANYGSTVLQDLQNANVKVTYEKPKGDSIWITLFTYIIPFVVILFLFFFLLNQAQGGGSRVMNFGKSKAKLYNEEKRRVTFDDVAGADEEKAELVEIVDFLKDNRRYAQMGARIPKGVLLVGPPGTGKTLLARAVAGEAKVPFFSISGSDFVEMFVGVGASRVRDLFEQAKKNAPCIIFIDEIDAVGRQRGAGLGGGHDEREQTLNQLLVEMDGFDVNSGIIIMAATNRPDILDPALLRPGRFDRQILVNRPDVKGREAVLKVHARNKPLAEDVKLEVIAQRTTGFSGADLENLLNEAALLAARHRKKKITMEEIDEAVDRVIAGPQKKSRVFSKKERKIVAYHESGHVLCGYYLQHADVVHKVTIVPRGQAGGYAMMLPKEDRYLATKNELLDRVTGLLGGRVAEEVVFGEISTGASNDFEKATSIVRSMITEYGMSDRLATMTFGRSQGQVFLGRDLGHESNYSDKIAYEIDTEMQDLIRSCYNRAKNLIMEHRDKLELLAQTLLEKETLDERQIKQLLENGKLDDDDSVKVNIQSKEEEETNKESTKQDNSGTVDANRAESPVKDNPFVNNDPADKDSDPNQSV